MSKILGAHISGTVGTIVDAPGGVAPVGTLLAFGQALNAVTNPIYQPLYNIIGNTYGGTDNTNFVVPDLRGRVLAGKDDMGGSVANRITSGGAGINGTALGASGGTQTHTLTTAQLATHRHRVYGEGAGGGPLTNIQNAGNRGLLGDSGTNTLNYYDQTGNANSFIEDTGSGTAHQNTQPTIIVNKAICYL